MAVKDGFEIERKFLIEYPDESVLKAQSGCKSACLAQAYIEGGGRVRKITADGRIAYIKTIKEHITDLTRREKEWEISAEEYESDIKNIAKGTSVINKIRYCIPYGGLLLEIDIFPFWNDRAFLEIELSNENEEFIIPDYVKIIKEVTFDKRYRNSALAREIVNESIK